MNDPYQKDFLVSWDELHRNARALAWRLAEMQVWEGVVAITRGGLVPACIMARELDIRLVETLCITSYDHKSQRDAMILKQPDLKDGGRGWMIVDDLVDTGRTLKIARKLYPNAHFTSIYAKPAGSGLVDTYITEVSQETWIHFPWDLATQYAVPIADQRKSS